MALTPGMAALQLNAVKTNTSAPAMGYFNRYDATAGALTVTLPALSGLNAGARAAVQKYTLDASGNAVTFNCAGSDKFDDGATASFTLSTTGAQREIQVVSLSGVKRWKFVGPLGSSVGDGQYFTFRNGDGQDASARTPFMATSFIDAADITGSGANLVNYGFNAVAEGDFTTPIASTTDPGYLWGVNQFTTTGTGPVDGNGIANLMNLAETSVRSGINTYMGWVTGFAAEAAFMEPTAKAFCTQMTSMQVLAPKYKSGASEDNRVITDGVISGGTTLTSASAAFVSGDVGARVTGTGIPGGTFISARTSSTVVTLSQTCPNGAIGYISFGRSGVAATVYGLWVEKVPNRRLASNAAYSVWVDGGLSHFTGNVEIKQDSGDTSDLLKVLSSAGAAIFTVDQNGAVFSPFLSTGNLYAFVQEEAGGGLIDFKIASSAMGASWDSTRWRLYLRPGTTGGTAKLCMKGSAGTETVILDNIAA